MEADNAHPRTPSNSQTKLADNAHPSASSSSPMKLDSKYILQDVYEEMVSTEYHLLTVEYVLEKAKEITDFLVYCHPNNFENAQEDMDGLQRKPEKAQAFEFLLYEDYQDDSIAGIYTVHGCSCMVHGPNDNGLKEIQFESHLDNQGNKGDLSVQLSRTVKVLDDEYFDGKSLLRSSIDFIMPEGYRLGSLEELKSCYTYSISFLVKETKLKVYGEDKVLWLMLRKIGHLRKGEDQDIQDVSHTIYFSYESNPAYEPRIRIKNGFIDMHRRLVWKEFSKHNIEYMLKAHCKCIEHESELKDEDEVVALLFSCALKSYEEIAQLKRDHEKFLRFMKKNNPNAPSGGSAIHLCAEEGRHKCLQKMFQGLSKDEINEACKAKAVMDGETPLHVALLKGKEKVVDMLCTEGSINEKTKATNLTPLMIVAKYKAQSSKLWKPLLACKGLRIQEENDIKCNIFHTLSSNREGRFKKERLASLLKDMLEKCGCKVSYKAYKVAGEQQDLTKDVIEEVATLHKQNFLHTFDPRNGSSVINHKNKRMQTPLHTFLSIPQLPSTHDLDIVDEDDDDDSDDDAKTLDPPPYEFVPIQFSILLISAGANIEAVDKERQNALHRVCQLPKDNYKLCQILHHCILNDPDVSKWARYISSQNFYGQTPLHIAAKSGNVEILHFLLNSADKNVIDNLIKMRDYNDHTIFHAVASLQRRFKVEDEMKLEIAKEIWKKAEEIYKEDSKKVLQLIIWSVGEGVGLADELAAKNRYSKLSTYLEEKRKNSKENLLALAMEYDNFDMVLELINRGAVITKKMRHHAQIGELLKKEKSSLIHSLKNKDKGILESDQSMCGPISKNLLYGVEARMQEVESKIKDWKSKSKGIPTLDKIKALEAIKLSHRGRTTDQPTDEDLLEREDIKSSISALLLNQHMGSPITLGILGGTGMGKSSMMLQVEHYLLSRAAKETLRLTLDNSRNPISESTFTGAKLESSKARRHAKELLRELEKVIRKIEYNKKDDGFDYKVIDLENDPLESRRKTKWNFSLEYLSKPFKIIKSMLVSTYECEVSLEETMEEKIESYITKFKEDEKWVAKRLALASDGEEVPALMTVRFDAWQYENKDEAWAGMAIEILKEMESSMTKAQLLYASVMHSIKRNQSYARLNWMFPMISYLVLGGIVGLISYILFSIPKSPYAKSGSILVAVSLTVWKVLSQFRNFVKPISDKLQENTQSLQREHISKAGYQHQVIEDINFLRNCMTDRDISLIHLWKLLAYILNIQSTSTFLASRVEASDALKHIPQHKDRFRIIVFIDNLDRQKEKLFTPLNMILKSCNINAVVAMDKEVVDDVFDREPEENVEDLKVTAIQKETLLTQLIQIPIVLPEPDDHELNNTFLKHHLKDMGKKKKTSPPRSERAVDQNSAENITSSGTKQNPSLHQATCLSVELFPTNKSHPIEHSMVKSILQSAQPSQEISIETEVHPSHSIERSLTNDNLPREYEMVKKCLHTAQHPQDIMHAAFEDEESNDEEIEEEKKEKQKAWRDIKLNVLDSNYSRGEIEIFQKLSKHTYDYYRSPRAWKSLLNYHRLIRSLLTCDKHNVNVKAWKRQLVIWVFFCWQWKHQMNEIFENWQDLTRFDLQELENDKLLVGLPYREDLEKVLMNDYQLVMLKKKRYEHLWHNINTIYKTLSDIVSSIKSKRASSSNQKPQPEGCQDDKMKEISSQMWSRISEALTYGDIDLNMQCMLLFQKYRFDCKPGVLKLCIS